MASEYLSDMSAPPAHAKTITPNDDVDLAVSCRAVRCATAGNLAYITVSDETDAIPGVLAGETIVLRCRRILATGTTATGITVFW